MLILLFIVVQGVLYIYTQGGACVFCPHMAARVSQGRGKSLLWTSGRGKQAILSGYADDPGAIGRQYAFGGEVC